MLDDILNFASDTLVDDGRLSFWMPTANDEAQEIAVPTHPCLEIVTVCTQVFNRCKLHRQLFVTKPEVDHRIGSRRLITYRRIPDSQVDQSALALRKEQPKPNGITADDLNDFRRQYFKGFKLDSPSPSPTPDTNPN